MGKTGCLSPLSMTWSCLRHFHVVRVGKGTKEQGAEVLFKLTGFFSVAFLCLLYAPACHLYTVADTVVAQMAFLFLLERLSPFVPCCPN